MTQTNANTGGPNTAAYGVNSASGAVNLRASHTIAIRVRHTSTATNFDSDLVGYSINSGGNNQGTFISRINGDPATQLAWFRWNGVSTFDIVRISGVYGNTTSWFHLALVYDATGTLITPYVDGVAQTTVSSATTTVTSTTTCRLWAGGPHPGVFCDAAFFGRALTAPEVAQLAKLRVPQTRFADLIGFYPEFGDGVTTDHSSHGNTLSVINSGSGSTPTASNEAPPGAPWLGRSPYIIVPSASSVAETGAAGIQSAASGTLSVAAALAGSSGIQSAASGNLSQQAAKAGASGIQSAASGNLSTAAALSGAGGVQSAASGILTVSVALSGTSGIQSAASGSLLSASGGPPLGTRQDFADRRFLAALGTRRRVRR